jgi:hypothetical protein
MDALAYHWSKSDWVSIFKAAISICLFSHCSSFVAGFVVGMCFIVPVSGHTTDKILAAATSASPVSPPSLVAQGACWYPHMGHLNFQRSMCFTQSLLEPKKPQKDFLHK